MSMHSACNEGMAQAHRPVFRRPRRCAVLSWRWATDQRKLPLTGDDGGSAGHDSNSEDDQGVNCMGMAVVIAVQSTNEIRAVSRLLESSSRVPSR